MSDSNSGSVSGLIEDLSSAENVEKLEEMGSLFYYGCVEDKRMLSCHSLGKWLEFFKADLPKAVPVYRQTCLEYKFGESCMRYANCKLLGRGVEKDEKEAYDFLKIGCDQGRDAKSCFALANLSKRGFAGQKPRLKQADSYLRLSCEMDYAPACFTLHSQFMRKMLSTIGRGKDDGADNMKKSDAKSEITSQTLHFGNIACDLGHPVACKNLAIMYRKGDGVSVDEEKENYYKERAALCRKAGGTDRTWMLSKIKKHKL